MHAPPPPTLLTTSLQEILKWLHKNRGEGCTQEAVDWAAGNGHVDVLHWLISTRRVGYSTRAVEWATKNDHSESVALLEKIRAQ